MAERPEKSTKAATVEVRLVAKQIQQQLADGTFVTRKRGDVFHVDRSVWESDLEPDRGMGRPARGRAFALVADERKAVQEKETAAAATQDRIAAVREGVRDQLQTMELSRAQSKVQEAENAKLIAETLKPIERPGARRVS